MNTFGRRLRLSLFGESHGPGIGITLDGVPPGLPVDPDAIQRALDERRPGTGPLVSARREKDAPQILSGVHGGRATGAPLTVWIQNQDARPQDYERVRRLPRPGHADFTQHMWSRGHHDPRGGGHASGRLTAPLVAAAAIVRPLLEAQGIRTAAHLHQVGDLSGPPHVHNAATAAARAAGSPVRTAHAGLEKRFLEAILAARQERDSLGGLIEFVADGVPVAWGDPFFDSVESLLAHLLFSVPAVKGVDFGAGFAAAAMRSSEHNDPFAVEGGRVVVGKNDAGGILGGRTTGASLRGRVAVKPTSSILRPQETVDLGTGEPARLDLTGRHDPCIAVRAVPVVRACLDLVLADLLLLARQEGHVPPAEA